MTFSDYWARLKAATPELGNDHNLMRLSVLNFRIATAKAYAAGRDEARQEIKQTAERVAGDGIMDVFRDIFGGKR